MRLFDRPFVHRTVGLVAVVLLMGVSAQADMCTAVEAPLMPDARFAVEAGGELQAYTPFGKYRYAESAGRWIFAGYVSLDDVLADRARQRTYLSGDRYRIRVEGKTYRFESLRYRWEYRRSNPSAGIRIVQEHKQDQMGRFPPDVTAVIPAGIPCAHDPTPFLVGFDGRFVWFGLECFLGEGSVPVGAGYFDVRSREAGFVEPTSPAVFPRAITTLAGRTWIATSADRQSGVGLLSFDQRSHKFRRYTAKTSGLLDDATSDVVAHRGRLWIASSTGFSRFDPTTGRWTGFRTTRPVARRRLNVICGFLSDPEKMRLSLGTIDKGARIEPYGWVACDCCGMGYSLFVVKLPVPFVGIYGGDRKQLLQSWTCSEEMRARREAYYIGPITNPNDPDGGSCWPDVFGPVTVLSNPEDSQTPLRVQLGIGGVGPEGVRVDFERVGR